MKKDKYLEQCFKGEIIYGDNFTLNEINNWFEKEKEGYSKLGTNELEDLNNNIYHYHELNKEYGFNYIRDINDFQNVLGLGSATGIEFEPLVEKIKKLYVLEPSEELRANKIKSLEINYKEPSISGEIDFENNKFDLITSFGVLHHIPNVSFVMSEISRVLKKGGVLLLREPIVSMGDWREERYGLTKNERGIPIKAFKQIILQNNLEIVAENYCFTLTTPLNRIFIKFFKNPIYYYKTYILFDKILSKFFRFNIKYHSSNKFDKFYPQNVFFVLKKGSLD
ncbi:methyltransferase domain-containing protein [Flavobacterium sp.]|jgi:SAM-dependent methyltransferase|uniref:methyltransferase domain-containing protein n=1 Tax=Flavobacterium sp. TaxID=239 RepID=UPI0037C13926